MSDKLYFYDIKSDYGDLEDSGTCGWGTTIHTRKIERVATEIMNAVGIDIKHLYEDQFKNSKQEWCIHVRRFEDEKSWKDYSDFLLYEETGLCQYCNHEALPLKDYKIPVSRDMKLEDVERVLK